MPFTTKITLTSVKDPLDQRCLAISHGTPTPIGRASRSGHGNVKPAVSNAFFASPVVSRYHAELKMNQWASANEQVTLIDKDSMHGTFVNGRRLPGFKPMALHVGDVIQFGAQVSRGSEIHDGVAVTYDRINSRPEPPALPSQYFTAPAKAIYSGPSNSQSTSKRGFEVPYASDEESDMMSDDGYSVSSYDDHESEPTPAKFAPGQPKSNPGSAEQPIELDSMTPAPSPSRAVIDLEEDEDEDDMYGSTLKPGRYRPQTPTRANLEKESPLKLTLVNLSQDSLTSSIKRSTPALTDDAEADSVRDRRTSPAVAVASSVRDDESEICEECSDGEELDYPDEEEGHNVDDADEEGDAEQDETSSIVSDRDESVVSAMLEDDEPQSYSTKKQPSPELGSLQAHPPTTAAEPEHATPPISSAPKSSTQPPYDPVRASASLSNADTWWPCAPSKPLNPSSQLSSKPYTYATLPAADTFVSPHANVSNSSRWDVAPGASSNLCEPARSSTWLYGDRPGYYRPFAYPRSRATEMGSFPFSHEWNTAPAFHEQPYPPAVAAGETPTLLSKKIRVGDLLEGDVAATDKSPARPVPDTTATNGKKRKAAEMDAGAVDQDITTPAPPLARVEHPPPLVPSGLLTPDTAEPPARRRKIEEPSPSLRKKRVAARRNAVGKAVKIAAAVTIGSVGTMAFLISPLVDKVIDFLP